MLDLEAYLARIGLGGEPSLAAVHRAHVNAIPFENLDPHRGVPVSLALENLERKLVRDRRGGYCFEQNLLLAAALRELGHEVEPMLARVRFGATSGAVRPRSHVVLRVSAGGEAWHADVGFGHGTLLEPIPFGPGDEHDQSGWRFRIVAEGGEHVLQTLEGSDWVDVYGFVPEPVPFVDIDTSNWFTCTHPRSPFRAGLIVAVNRADGTRVAMSDWNGLSLITRTPSERTVTEPVREDIPGLLERVFGLPGFALAANGRVTYRNAHSE